MRNGNSPLDVIADPLLLESSRRLMSPAGRRNNRVATVLAVTIGIVDGLAMLALLPTATAMALGTPQWGLGLAGWLWVLLALAVVNGALRYIGAVINYGTTLDMMRTAHGKIGDKLAILSLGWYQTGSTGSLSRLVSDGFMAIAQALAHVVFQFLGSVSAMLTIAVGSWFWDVRLGLTLTIAAPVALVVMVLAQSLKRAASHKVTPSDQEMAARIVEFAACQPGLRAAGRSSSFEPLERAADDNYRARVAELWKSTFALVLNGVVVQMIVVLIITGAADLAVDGRMGPIQTIAFIGLTLRFTRTLSEVGDAFVGATMGREPLLETMSILDAPVLPQVDADAELTRPGSIEFDHVSFAYDGSTGRLVLDDVSFTLAPGTMTALVGPSGSGKTTVARLISRFWDVSDGAIRVGGADVRQQPSEQLMAQLSMVFQDVYLFDDTLIENILVGRDGATDAEVRAAADLAGVTAIAERLPDGWDSRVGEGGRSLSGGERQRVSIARALLKGSPIVLFDEATSSLDAENEANIITSIEELRKTATVLIIAHKLDTVRNADTIIVLDDHGRVAESGTHDELFAADGAYRRFWDRRAAASGWSIGPAAHHR